MKTIQLGDNVEIGRNVTFDDGVIIHDNAEIGDNCVLGKGSCLNEHVTLGNNVNLSTNVVIYGESTIHQGVIIYFDCVIEGSEIEEHAIIYEKTHITQSFIGKNSVIGEFCEISHSKIHDGYFIADRCEIFNCQNVTCNIPAYSSIKPKYGVSIDKIISCKNFVYGLGQDTVVITVINDIGETPEYFVMQDNRTDHLSLGEMRAKTCSMTDKTFEEEGVKNFFQSVLKNTAQFKKSRKTAKKSCKIKKIA
jgi:carbonic anhydrase/acetyltransferase-like protein (isoleucine patch superfamily)